jgi:hypothetical protein
MPSPPKKETLEQREKRLQRQREYESRRKAKDPIAYKKYQLESAKKWRDANPEKRKASVKTWREKNRDKWNESRRNYYERNVINMLFLGARSRAKKKGIEFNIELSDIPEIPITCPLLGLPFTKRSEGLKDTSPSLDRIDPKKGYIKGNVWIVGYRANLIKNDGTAQEHQKIADAMRKSGVF